MQQKFCLHCTKTLISTQKQFCCSGCKIAYKIIKKGGFVSYYQMREVAKNGEFNQPTESQDFPIEEFIEQNSEEFSLKLMISGMHCAACIWLIENVLQSRPEVILARINLSQKTLSLRWKGGLEQGKQIISLLNKIGYKTFPLDSKNLDLINKNEEQKLTKALAVAGFGAGNIMLFSFSLWFANSAQMGIATRQFLHFFSSLIALPVIIYSGRIFFISAFNSIKLGHPNMDLPITLAILLASLVSLFQAFAGGEHVYFDSAVMLVFFLLIGRFLDFKMRKKAFNIATEFTLLAANFGRVEEGTKILTINAKNLQPNMILLVANGEKIAGDGIVIEGESIIDNSLISGEGMPKKVKVGSQIFAGTINLGSPLRIRVTAKPSENLISQIAKLVENFESKKGHFIRIADRWSKIYTPAVHLLAFLTFLGWIFWLDASWQSALMKATAVLVITCPCALALAVPIVQTVAIGLLIKNGIIVKNSEIFEKINQIQTIIFDKTGTLTEGKPRLDKILLITENGLKNPDKIQELRLLEVAASIAKQSRHTLSQAICQKFEETREIKNNKAEFFISEVKEFSGFGLEGWIKSEIVKLGKKDFCKINFEEEKIFKNSILADSPDNSELPFLHCFMRFGNEAAIFTFQDQLKNDAKLVLEKLRKMGKRLILLSGDEKNAVRKIATELGIKEFYGEQTPAHKAKFLEELKREISSINKGNSPNKNSVDEIEFIASEATQIEAKFERSENLKVLMIGDGINDAPSLSLADVSMSFNKGSDLSQNVADIVICGDKLEPILLSFEISSRTLQLMRQNLLLALIYNGLAVPFAIAGFVVPLFAALAMSSSSILVILNAIRVGRK